MKREIADVQDTLEYAHSHDLARKALPFALFGVVIGLFLLMPLENESFQKRNKSLGALVVVLSLVFTGIVIYRRLRTSVPGIVMSPRGVMIRDFSEKPIPWNEIIEVGYAKVSGSKDFFSTKVVKLAVSKRFYEAYSGGTWHESVVASSGSPSEIYVSYYHSVPIDEFHAAARLRWQAFSRHAGGLQPIVAAQSGGGPSNSDRSPPEVQPRRSVVERGTSIGVLGAFADLVRGASLGYQLATALALAALLAILTNLLGFWSTAGQSRARASQAEWRAKMEKFDADLRATDIEQRRIREMWDRRYKCMDEYWSQHERGTYKKDPDCMKEGK